MTNLFNSDVSFSFDVQKTFSVRVTIDLNETTVNTPVQISEKKVIKESNKGGKTRVDGVKLVLRTLVQIV